MGKKIRIGLLGFGKTGKLAVSEILDDPDCCLSWVVRRSEEFYGEFASRHVGLKKDEGCIMPMRILQKRGFFKEHPVDVIIDFSDRSALGVYINRAVRRDVRIVSAISHYSEDEIKLLKKSSKKIAILYSPNITVGVNVLMVASQVLKKILPNADIEIVEEHFRDKRDKSGTALRIAKRLGLNPDTHVNSIRVGGIIGRHEVIFGMKTQTVRLIHETVSRAAFARGALFATKWLIHKKNGLYNMENVIKNTFIQNLSD